MGDEWTPTRFIDEEITIAFDRPPARSKVPGPPSMFTWEGKTFRVDDLLGTWSEFERKGRMARNMAPAHLRSAAHIGSWGVGRFFFRVSVEGGRVFDLYYDRAPESAGDRAGHWFLYRELEKGTGAPPMDPRA
ncbi:MAG TPA: DUF6504 family protein [Anaerolineales bacterium]|nr:DUF6504 family protein [Anaerolineales bacterium]